MIVMKFGGSSFKDSESVQKAVSIIKENSFSNRIVVVSALYGVTDLLEQALDASVTSEGHGAQTCAKLEMLHDSFINDLISGETVRNETAAAVHSRLTQLKRQLTGICYTQEATPRIRDAVLSTGERLSAALVAGCLRDQGVEAAAVHSDDVGLMAQGEWGNGTAVLDKAKARACPVLRSLLAKSVLPVVTGFFGVTEQGHTITFGRGGSDYAAAVLARIMGASYLEIWKDVQGFLTGSPDIVDNARLLSSLSYEEAAELAYFGAKILHPRTMEPLAEKEIPIVIRSTFHQESPGTWIGPDAYEKERVAKSVTFDSNVALLRIYGANIGYAVHLLSDIVTILGDEGINIRSVFTAQTCINILLNGRDLNRAYEIVGRKQLASVEAVEKSERLGLVAIAGHGMGRKKDVVSEAFACLTRNNIQVELVMSGASKVASYFLLQESKVHDAMGIIHTQLFSECLDQ